MSQIALPHIPSIVPISERDFPILTEFIYSSKLSLAINSFLYEDWPNEATQKPIYRQAVESSFSNLTSLCLKAVHQESGDIIGYLVLTRKRPGEGSSPKEESTAGQDVLEGMNAEVFSTVAQAANKISEETDQLDRLG
jgi:hypothetical protein